jgi:hypothetical protein
MASDFINEQELLPLITRIRGKERRDIRLIGLVLSAFDWEDDELVDFQLINGPHEPLNTLGRGDQERVLAKMSKEVRLALQV